jgi:hypothetical protein
MSGDKTPASGFKSDDEKNKPTAHNEEGTPGVALAGGPGTGNDDCKPHYREQRHELFGAEAENSPSTGWKGVYAEMEVAVNAHL